MQQNNFTTKAASDYLKSLGLIFTPGTLEVWRCLGRGPRFKRVARKIFYEQSALDDFAQGQLVETVDSITGKH